MIYEMLKMASVGGLSWGEYAGVVFFSVFAIYISLWILGWITCRAYSFVQDGEDTIPHFMGKVMRVFNSTPDNGWVRVNGVWMYHLMGNGLRVGHTDSLEKVNRQGGAEEVKGILSFINYKLFLWVFPFILSIGFLLGDTFPVAAAGVGLSYVVLLIARKAVRIGKKINKHIGDEGLHSNAP